MKLNDHCLEIKDAAFFKIEQLLAPLDMDAGVTDKSEVVDQTK